MRSPLAFSEVSVNPSFLRTTPAKKPRTECSCQPVVFMIAAIVAPLGCPSRVRTASCLVPRRLEDDGVFTGFATLFSRPLARAGLVLLWVLLCHILGSVGVCDGITRRPHRSPTVAASPAGRDPDRADRPLSQATLTLCLQQKSSPFCNEYCLQIGFPCGEGRYR